MHVEMNVVYINYCYDISDLLNLTKRITSLMKYKELYNIKLTKFMNKNNLTPKQIEANPALFTKAPSYSYGGCNRKKLTMQETDSMIKEIISQIMRYEEEHIAGATFKRFLGSAFIML